MNERATGGRVLILICTTVVFSVVQTENDIQKYENMKTFESNTTKENT